MQQELIILAIILGGVVVIFIKQLDILTNKIDMQEEQDMNNQKKLDYASFARFLQSQISQIKEDLAHEKIKANENFTTDQIKEFLAICTRKLVILETLKANQQANKLEQEFFDILSALEDFLLDSMENAKELTTKLRNEQMQKMQELKA